MGNPSTIPAGFQFVGNAPDGMPMYRRLAGKPETVQIETERQMVDRIKQTGDFAAIPVKPRIRQSSKPLMNGLESECLEHLKQSQLEPKSWLVQAIRLRLGNGIWYKPDLFNHSTALVVEVKGPHSFRGGFENLKVAASLYPWLDFWLMWKANGEWQQQLVKP